MAERSSTDLARASEPEAGADAAALGARVRELERVVSELQRDVCAAAARDKLLRTMWDNVPDGAVYRLVCEPDGSVRMENVSAGFEALFELSEERVCRDAGALYGLLHPEDAAPALDAQQRSAQALTPFRHECRFILPSGRTRWVCWHSMPERLPDGVVAWTGMALDVTARKQAEAALLLLNDQLEAKVLERTAELRQRSRQLAELAEELTLAEHRARCRLADYLHEDVQQLLVAARMQAQALAPLAAPARRAVDQLVATLNEALARTRLMTQEIAPSLIAQRDLAAGFGWLLRDARARLQLKISARVRVRGASSPIPEAVTVLLFSAARELLLNVVKHAETRRVGLTLTQKRASVVLAVQDEGRGFERAGLSDGALHGLGLFGIRERVELLGGAFALDAAPGRGVRVTLTLPLPADAAAPVAAARGPGADAPVQAGRRPRRAGKRARPLRLLFVDDHRVVRESLANLLGAEDDMSVVGQCSNGLEAVERVPEVQPDVVIMDVNMPVMDGIEATRHIKREWPAVKVVGLSMYDDAEGGKKMREAGADAYVTKAGPLGRLLEVIRACVRAPGGG